MNVDYLINAGLNTAKAMLWVGEQATWTTNKVVTVTGHVAFLVLLADGACRLAGHDALVEGALNKVSPFNQPYSCTVSWLKPKVHDWLQHRSICANLGAGSDCVDQLQPAVLASAEMLLGGAVLTAAIVSRKVLFPLEKALHSLRKAL